MADFELAVAKTLINEGGDKYTETPGDRGGATKYGISLRFLKTIIKDSSLKDIKNLTIGDATSIYRKYFWDDNRYGEIENQAVAEKVFDMSVLIGASKANKILQQSIGIGTGIYNADGIIGDLTLDILNKFNGMPLLIFPYMHYFINICNKDKTQSKFLLGWLNRVMS